MASESKEGITSSSLVTQAEALRERIIEHGDALDLRLPTKKRRVVGYLGRGAAAFSSYAPGFESSAVATGWVFASVAAILGRDMSVDLRRNRRMGELGGLINDISNYTGQSFDVLKGQNDLRLLWYGRLKGEDVHAGTDVKMMVNLATLIGATEIVTPEDIAKATSAPYAETTSYATYVKQQKGRSFTKNAPPHPLAIIPQERFDQWQPKSASRLDGALSKLSALQPKSQVLLAATRGPKATRNASARAIVHFIEADSANVPISPQNPTRVKQNLRYEVSGGYLISRVDKTGQEYDKVPLSKLTKQVRAKLQNNKATYQDELLHAYLEVYEATRNTRKKDDQDKLVPPSAVSRGDYALAVERKAQREKRVGLACGVAAVAIGFMCIPQFDDTPVHDKLFAQGPLHLLDQKLKDFSLPPATSAEGDASHTIAAQPDWIVRSHKGMSPYGYWPDGTSNVIEFGRNTDPQITHLQSKRELPTHGQRQYKSLEVRQTLTLPSSEVKSGQIYSIPVLVGTKVTAAEVKMPGTDQEAVMPVNLLSYADGAQKLQTTHSLRTSRLSITYWLQKDKYAPRIRATAPMLLKEDGQVRPIDHESVRAIWKMEGLQYPEGLSKLEYDLHAKEAQIDFGDETSFALSVLRRRAANCETTAELMVLTNPELNIASGYINVAPGDKKDAHPAWSYLSSHEQHGWAVNQKGEPDDQTPTRMSNETRKKFTKYTHEGDDFTPQFEKEGEGNPLKRLWRDYKLPAAGLLAVAGLFAPRLTRRASATLHRKSIEAGAFYYQRRAQKLSPENAGFAYEIIQQVLFDPSRKKVINRPGNLHLLDGNQAVKNLSEQIAPESDYGHLLRHLKQRVKLSKQEYKSLRTLLQAVKTRQQKAALYD